MSSYTYTGTSRNDDIDLDKLVDASPYSSSFQIDGKNGDDEFYTEGQANTTFNGGHGDDYMFVYWLEGDSTIRFSGGIGNDAVQFGSDFENGDVNGLMLRQGEDPVFTRYKDGTVVRLIDTDMGYNATVYIEDSVEFIVFLDELGNDSEYLTSDLASGITKKYFGDAESTIDWWYDEKAKSTTTATSTDASQLNIINGTNKKDKLTGTDGDDAIYGKLGADKINGKGGDDLIDSGEHRKGGKDKVTGGSGSDTFVIKEGYWAWIKDFKIIEDKLDLSGLSNGLDYDYRKKWTYIWGEDGDEVARFKGRVDLSKADII